ncbi:hypothetical protein ACFQAT_25710 [Undibacterium arcticum]|uniref:ParM/StbA family protein n=1 Tax=Undibacterium arcticum TaxID=1762892 RepID=UPI00361C19BE
MTTTRAIDVGHGNTKFTTADGEFEFGCKVFPSIAPQPRNSLGMTGGVLSAGEFIEVEIDGASYVVGRDSETAESSSTMRLMDAEYSLSNIYMALVRGALYYMKTPKIDMLVLGLPLTTFESHREKLRERMVGGHTIPNPHLKANPGAPAKMSVQVANVRICHSQLEHSLITAYRDGCTTR